MKHHTNNLDENIVRHRERDGQRQGKRGYQGGRQETAPQPQEFAGDENTALLLHSKYT